MDEAIFIDAEGARLLTHLHRPPPGRSGGLGAVVCAPFADEHVACYRMLRRLSLALAAAGVAVVRFDPRGLGDSEGDLAEAAPELALRDVERAMGALAEHTGAERIGFVGVRLGAPLAALAASRLPAAFVAALAPVLSAERYFQRLLRRQVLSDAMYGGEVQSLARRIESLRAGSVLDVGGYPLSRALYEGYCAIDFVGILEKLAVPVWVGLVSPSTSEADRIRAAGVSPTAPTPELVASGDPRFWELPDEGSVCPDPQILVSRLIDWIAAQRAASEPGDS